LTTNKTKEENKLPLSIVVSCMAVLLSLQSDASRGCVQNVGENAKVVLRY
jgi:hypothetical protein